MKIGILALSSMMSGGTYQYTESLLESLLKYTSHDYFIINHNGSITPEISRLNKGHFVEIKKSPSNIFLKIKRAIYVSLPVSRGFLDVSKDYKTIRECNLNLIINPITSFIPIYVGSPYIVTIHDLQHKYYPEFFTLKERVSRNYVYKNAAKNALLVTCESNFVMHDIVNFLGVPKERIRVVPSPPPLDLTVNKISCEELERTKVRYNLTRKYLFYPAHLWYHKNHVKLIESLNLIRKRYKEEIPLILVGSQKGNFKNTMRRITDLNLDNQISWLGYVPKKDMLYLYKLATALVMPTLFESVSMPIWEAFFLGVPVVSSNVCALPEQVGEAGVLFDPNNINDMAEKIYTIWTDESLRKELVKKGYERVKDMTLEDYAKQWEEVLQAAIRDY
jgi:glycosyltransferase involved in cell wall biosynthesis